MSCFNEGEKLSNKMTSQLKTENLTRKDLVVLLVACTKTKRVCEEVIRHIFDGEEQDGKTFLTKVQHITEEAMDDKEGVVTAIRVKK